MMNMMSQRILSENEVEQIRIDRDTNCLKNGINNCLFYGASNINGIFDALHEMHKRTKRRQSTFNFDDMNSEIKKRMKMAERIIALVNKSELTSEEKKQLQKDVKKLSLQPSFVEESKKLIRRRSSLENKLANGALEEAEKQVEEAQLEIDRWMAGAFEISLEEYLADRSLYWCGYREDNKYLAIMRRYDEAGNKLDGLRSAKNELAKLNRMPLFRQPYKPDYLIQPKTENTSRHIIPAEVNTVGELPGIIGGNGNGEASGL